MKDPNLRVYAVYVPILRTDAESSVTVATTRLSDQRVSFFWDGKGELAKAYSRIMKLGQDQPAWDIYFVFGRDAEWKNEPPAPAYWMHQLRLDPERRLDGNELAAEINRLLQSIDRR
ncbi:MAG: hypothetical protein LC776_16605 [Acidobacteria bacterium]|nr:hypothetical protein [Acidobacteriota bacterium]